MSNKYSIFSFVLLSTITLFSINLLINQSKNIIVSRNLQTKEQTDKICNNGGDILHKYMELEEANNDFNVELNKYQEAILEILDKKTADKELITKYIIRVMIFLIVICLDVVLIIMWFVYCSCCCCPCCCFKQKGNETCCRNCACFFTLICSGLLVFGCFAGILLRKEIKENINATVCSLFIMTTEVQEGERKETVPRWPGTDGIMSLMDDIKSTVNEISSQESSRKCHYVQQKKNDCKINSGCNVNYETFHIEEYNTKLNEGNDKLKNVEIKKSEISQKIDDSKSTIVNLNDAIGTIRNDYGGKIYDATEDYVNKYIDLVFYILFGIFLVLGVLAFLSVFLFTCFKVSCMKCTYHIIWNLEIPILFLTTLVGSILGIVGYIGKDVSNVSKYIISKQNLLEKKIVINLDDKTANVANICFNGNGNITKELGFELDDMGELSELYQLVYNIDQVISQLEQFKQSTENQKFVNLMDSMIGAYKEIQTQLKNLIKVKNKLGSEDLFSFINCKFMGRDVNILIEELEKSIGETIATLSYILLLVCLICGLSIFFGLITVLRHPKKNVVTPINAIETFQVKNNIDTDLSEKRFVQNPNTKE